MAGQFDLQPNFPIASVAQLYAQRPEKEAAMRAQQQQQLVQGLQGFGQGVQMLVNRRDQMAQALAQAKWYSQTPSGQQALGINKVTTSSTGTPVTMNQTAAYDPATGSVTPNQSQNSIGHIAAALYGAKPEDFLKNITDQKRVGNEQGQLALAQQIEPQKVAIEGRKATAEEENNAILRQIQAKMAIATVANQQAERAQAEENANREANKTILNAGSPLNPFNPITFAQKRAAIQSLSSNVDHGAAIKWAKDHPNDPRSNVILKRASGAISGQ